MIILHFLFVYSSILTVGIVGAGGGADAGGVRQSRVAQGVRGGNGGVGTALHDEVEFVSLFLSL